MPAETFVQEKVKCGKAHCRSCPHGPYWYAYRREGKRIKKRYVGKERPANVEPSAPPGVDRFAYLDAQIAVIGWTLDLAWEVLETGPMASLTECRDGHTKLLQRHWGNTFADVKHRARISEAYRFILSRYGV